MIEKIKYIEDDWDKFEQGIRFFLKTYDEIIKSDKEPRFRIETNPTMVEMTTIDPYKDSEYFICIDRVYGDKGLSLDETISKIKEVLMDTKYKQVFLKKKGDGYNYGFNYNDGTVDIAFCISYHNARPGLVFGLSHIYYGK